MEYEHSMKTLLHIFAQKKEMKASCNKDAHGRSGAFVAQS